MGLLFTRLGLILTINLRCGIRPALSTLVAAEDELARPDWLIRSIVRCRARDLMKIYSYLSTPIRSSSPQKEIGLVFEERRHTALMEHEKGRYMVEVIGLPPEARREDVYQFFINCGNIKHLEIYRVSADVSMAKVEFEDAYSVKIALFLSGSEIANQPVAITSCGTYTVDPSPYLANFHEADSVAMRSDQFVSTPGEAVTVVQEVVHSMISKGYVLGKDAVSKAKAFDESHKVSSKIAEMSKRIGLTDKIHSGMLAAKSIDETYRVRELSKSAAAYSSQTATAVVNSPYFAKGALWVSDVLDRAAKATADLAYRNVHDHK